MEDQNNQEDKAVDKNENKGILSYEDDDKQSLFRIFGIVCVFFF